MTHLLRSLALTVLLGSAATHANLIVNGDFEAGNTGFLTAYDLDANVSAAGTYTVASVVPNGWAPGFGDHTTGTGNMAIFNAATTPLVFWGQNLAAILVTGADYEFSFWVAALTESIRPGTSPSITLGPVGLVGTQSFQTAGLDDIWQQVIFTFTAPASGSFLALFETRGIFSGNDFAIDDISLVRTDIVATVPEPSMAGLLLAGFPLLVFYRRSREGRGARR